MNFMRRCLIGEQISEGSEGFEYLPEESVWIYVETKNLMTSRQMIGSAGLIPSSATNDLEGGFILQSGIINAKSNTLEIDMHYPFDLFTYRGSVIIFSNNTEQQ